MPDEPDPHGPVRYWRFYGETVRELRARLHDAGDDAILQVNVAPNRQATLEVLDPSQDAAARLAPLNESHPCPPDCG